MRTQEKSLGELLKQAGKLKQEQVEEALEEQKHTREPFGKILVRLGFVQERDILQVLEGMTALTFETGSECFGLETYRVREVVHSGPIQTVPLSVPEWPGLTMLRGEVLPVLSFRALLGLEPIADSKETWFVVLAQSQRPFVLWIDVLRDVLRFPVAHIEPMPSFLYGKRSDLFFCLGKMDGRLYSMINPDRLARVERIPAVLEDRTHASPA
jgi:chemotaxis signal transduction protein